MKPGYVLFIDDHRLTRVSPCGNSPLSLLQHIFTLRLNQRRFALGDPKKKEQNPKKWEMFKRPPCVIQGDKEGKDRKEIAKALQGYTKKQGMPNFRATQFPVQDEYAHVCTPHTTLVILLKICSGILGISSRLMDLSPVQNMRSLESA